MRVGLLKTAGLGRLKTADSAYKKPDLRARKWNLSRNHLPSNYANSKEYFVFFLTRFRVVENSRGQGRDSRNYGLFIAQEQQADEHGQPCNGEYGLCE